jgi:hypothetical protein
MAKTIRKGGSMRSTRSRKSKIVGGLNLKHLLGPILFALSLVDTSAHRGVLTPPGQDVQSAELEKTKRQDEALRKAFSDKLGGVVVTQITRNDVFIDPSSITKLQDFLKKTPTLKDKIYVTEAGQIIPKKLSLLRHYTSLLYILDMMRHDE